MEKNNLRITWEYLEASEVKSYLLFETALKYSTLKTNVQKLFNFSLAVNNMEWF